MKTTIKEMMSEGWKPRTINGVRVLQMDTFLCQNHNADYWRPDSMFDVAEKLGRPDNIHTVNGQVTTIEYFALEETA